MISEHPWKLDDSVFVCLSNKRSSNDKRSSHDKRSCFPILKKKKIVKFPTKIQEIIGASQGRLLYGALIIPNMVMAFDGDYFQQSIGVIMGMAQHQSSLLFTWQDWKTCLKRNIKQMKEYLAISI